MGSFKGNNPAKCELSEKYEMKSKFLLILIISGLVGGSLVNTHRDPSRSLSGTVQEENLDLREANVINVEFEYQTGDTYEFEVTLYHDDDGEEGYADWWQVETLNGELLGRRDLTHAHGTQPFTRSHRVTIPPEINYIIIRGHDQTHEYGGQLAIINLTTEEMELIDQGSAPISFTEYLTTKLATQLTTVEVFSNPRGLGLAGFGTFFIISILIMWRKRIKI